jgi:hypothetical protein
MARLPESWTHGQNIYIFISIASTIQLWILFSLSADANSCKWHSVLVLYGWTPAKKKFNANDLAFFSS